MPRRLHITERDGSATVEIDGHDIRVVESDVRLSVRDVGGRFSVDDGTGTWHGAAAVSGDVVWVDVDGQVFECHIDARARGASAGDDALMSPMPATVVRIAVTPDQRVERGDLLIALEAMKMELPIRAPRDGVVRALHCRAGDLVQPGTALVDLES